MKFSEIISTRKKGRGIAVPREAYNQRGKYAFFVFQSLPGYANSGEAVVYDRAIVAGECVPLHCERGNIDGKNDRASFCSCLLLRVPFIAYQFSLLFPYHSSHQRPPLVPAHADAFGQFLFHRADESGSRSNPETARAHLTSINNDVTFRPESLRSTHSPSLSLSLSLFLFVLSVRNCLRVAILSAFA